MKIHPKQLSLKIFFFILSLNVIGIITKISSCHQLTNDNIHDILVCDSFPVGKLNLNVNIKFLFILTISQNDTFELF